MNRQIVHMDMDAFFVSCTLLKLPELKGRPVIIGGSANRGIVLSASNEAQRYGILPSMPTRVALQRCPDAAVIKGDFDMFSQYSNVINEIITEKAPVHERAGMDEFYIDMTGMDRFFGTMKFTNELAGSIKKETGLPLSYGLSINKTVAKMCTNYAKPLGQLHVVKNEVQPFMDPQSIRNLPALGDVTYKFLRRIRIRIIETLRQVPSDSMQELLGKQGLNLWEKANGIDLSPVVPYTEQKSISTEKTFTKDTQDLIQLRSLLIGMVEKVAFQLREANLMCSILSVRIRYTNGDTETMQKRMSFTSNDDVLINLALELFKRLYQRRMLLRLIGIKLSGLVQGNHQINLFQDNIKMIRLYQAMDRMKHRFKNPMLIRRATGLSDFDRQSA